MLLLQWLPIHMVMDGIHTLPYCTHTRSTAHLLVYIELQTNICHVMYHTINAIAHCHLSPYFRCHNKYVHIMDHDTAFIGQLFRAITRPTIPSNLAPSGQISTVSMLHPLPVHFSLIMQHVDKSSKQCPLQTRVCAISYHTSFCLQIKATIARHTVR